MSGPNELAACQVIRYKVTPLDAEILTASHDALQKYQAARGRKDVNQQRQAAGAGEPDYPLHPRRWDRAGHLGGEPKGV